MASIKKVGFVGCGIMGAPIAGHILDAGYDLVVYNRTKAKTDELVAKGATWAASPAEAAKDADLVFTMVGYPTDVEDIYLGKDGILAAAKKGAYLVDLTTSSPSLARELHDAAEVEDKHAIDCPVTGGEAGAKSGTLTLIVGATEADCAPILPVLECFSGKIFYFDVPGAGQTAKLCNQISLANCMVGMADALALATQGGVDPAKVAEMIGTGTGASSALSVFTPKILSGDYKPGFLVEHFRKDIGLALQQADEYDLALPGSQTAFTLYDMLYQIGGARLGTQAINLLYAEEADAIAAGLDWSQLDMEPFSEEGCGCEDDECSCGHHHGEDHECCGGHAHHHHKEGHECCGGHGHQLHDEGR